MPEEKDADREERRCPYCRAVVAEEGHSGCRGLFREIMSDGYGSGAQELPPEAAAAAEDPSRRVHHYVLVRPAGRGGMGAVWKAWDLRLLRWVALKFLLSPDEDDSSRFLREARLAARLRHPHIAAVHEVGEAPPLDPGGPVRRYLAMEFVDGETLATARLPLDQGLRIFASVARAVDAAHRAGIIHRDLKPANILLSREGWPFVADFGLAKPIGPGLSLSASGAVLGTPAYMAPEQALGRLGEIDERSDVYSLGAAFYRVLCGRDPFEGLTPLDILRRVVDEEPVSPAAVRRDLPPAVDTILRKCMNKSKGGRYATASDLADDLDRHLQGEAIQGRAPGPLAVALRHARRSAISLALSFGLVAAVAALGWREWKSRTPQRLPETEAPEPERAAVRAAWRQAVEARHFRTARTLLESRGKALPADELKNLAAEADRICRNEQDERGAEFVRGLSRLRTGQDLADLPAERYESDFAVPDLQELTEVRPLTAWIRDVRLVLDRLKEGRANAWELADPARAGIPFEDGGSLPCFSALEPLAAEALLELLATETAAAADAPREVREDGRRRLDAWRERWSAFLGALPAEFRSRRPLLEEQDRRVMTRCSEFPAELQELASIDLLACLRSPDPDADLGRAQKILRSLESRTHVDLESRRRLYTMIVVAGVHRALLHGSTEEEAAQELRDYGPRLREVGGAADIGVYSPRVLRAVETLLRRFGQR